MLVSFQFEDSEDDFDRFDTDDELSYRRDSVYSCVTLPYFHSFLFIKGNYSAPWCLTWRPSFFNGATRQQKTVLDSGLLPHYAAPIELVAVLSVPIMPL